jgi:hypothetical protein
MPSFGGNAGPYPQSQEVDYAPPLKMKIERCYYATSINQMDDMGSQFQGTNMPGLVIKPQAMFLVIELAMTNYGNDPLSSRNPPLFQLRSDDGKTFDPHQGIGMAAQMMSSNINPGQALRAREVFDVPVGKYQLLVEHGQTGYGWSVSQGDLAWIWNLEPTPEK